MAEAIEDVGARDRHVENFAGLKVHGAESLQLAEAVVDVPVIFTSVQAENGCDKMGWVGDADFKRFCETQFAGWNSSVASMVQSLYGKAAVYNASFAFATLSSDTCVACGNAKLAVLAGGAFKSPVYHAVNVHWPSHGDEAFPYHTWDTTCAFETWEKRGRGWKPQPSDKAYGAALRAVWLALATDGKLPPELAPVSSAPGFPAHYDTLLLNTSSSTSRDFKTKVCAGLAGQGLDQRYWWVN